MKKYIVIALSVGGLNNKIFNAGDHVTEKQFPAGNADKLVTSGHLKLDDEMQARSQNQGNPSGSADSGSPAPSETVVITGDPLAEQQRIDTETAEAEALAKTVTSEESGGDSESKQDDQAESKSAQDVEVIPAFEEISKSEIVKKLNEKGIEASMSTNKSGLYAALVKSASSPEIL